MTAIWRGNMLGYLFLQHYLFREANSFPPKTFHFSEQVMPTDNYPSMFTLKMKATVYLFTFIPLILSLSTETEKVLFS